MFDFNKVGNTLNKIESFLTEQKKQKEVELLVQTAAIFQSADRTLNVDAAIEAAQNLIFKCRSRS